MTFTCSPNACYRQDGEILVRPAVVPLLTRIDSLVFDIDGVLIDVTESIATVDCLAVNTYLRLIAAWPEAEYITMADSRAFKLAGGFNDDWDLVKTMALYVITKAELARNRRPDVLRSASPTIERFLERVVAAGSGYEAAVGLLLSMLTPDQRKRVERQWMPDLVKRIFQELYAGETYCPSFYGFQPKYLHVPGLIHRDRPLLDRSLLPEGMPLGIFSGRTQAEVGAALELLRISERFDPAAVTYCEAGPLKPEPDGLIKVLAALKSEVAVYVGDMPDDREAVRRYRQRPGTRAAVIDCLVLTGPLGDLPPEEQLGTGADLVCEDVNQLCRWLNGRRKT